LIKDYLNTLKNKGNFTTIEIANLSGIPAATVRKILSGETDDPRFDTVAKLVSAMGGSLDEIAVKKGKLEIEANSIVTIKEMYDARINDFIEHIKLLRRDKLILSVVTGGLMLVIVLLLILDIIIGSHGWIHF
jgi:predicted transcriptional regulator